MPSPPLFRRLKERKLVQWALAYLAGAWVLVEATSLIVDQFNWPGVIGQAVTVLAFFGFFVALVLAWYHGEKGRQRVSGPELLMVAALFVVAGVALSALGGFEDAASVSPPREEDDRPGIAVLPCANMSADPADEYLASSIHDEILLKLQGVSALFSIGRATVEWYRDHPAPLTQVAQELGVGFVGDCSVQKYEDQIRLIFQLLDGRTGGQVWADDYDRDLTVGNLFETQRDIAQQVAHAIGAILTPEEQARIAARPTESLQAYDFYLRGNAYYQGRIAAGYTDQSYRTALQMFERAVEIDPGFALAHAGVADLHLAMVGMGLGDQEEHIELAREAVDRALEFAPDLPEAHLALADYYSWLTDYDLALREIAMAERARPGDASVLSSKAEALWRLERWDESVSLQYRVVALDPRGAFGVRRLGRFLALLRRYTEAATYMNRSIELEPENVAGRIVSAYDIPWNRDGNPEPWRRGIMDPDLPHLPWVGSWRWEASFSSRDFGVALDVLRTMDVEFERWPPYFPKPLLEGITHRFAGEPELARTAFESARVVLDERAQEQPSSPRVHRALSLAYAGLGMREPAIEEGLLVTNLLSSSQLPVWVHGFDDWGFAWIYALLGDHYRAIDHLDTILASPVGPTVNRIRADPWFDALRDHPRFQALVEKSRLLGTP
ncbi:hypothetical protein ACFL3S_12725 [Gemmatimonadota bacterium]